MAGKPQALAIDPMEAVYQGFCDLTDMTEAFINKYTDVEPTPAQCEGYMDAVDACFEQITAVVQMMFLSLASTEISRIIPRELMEAQADKREKRRAAETQQEMVRRLGATMRRVGQVISLDDDGPDHE